MSAAIYYLAFLSIPEGRTTPLISEHHLTPALEAVAAEFMFFCFTCLAFLLSLPGLVAAVMLYHPSYASYWVAVAMSCLNLLLNPLIGAPTLYLLSQPKLAEHHRHQGSWPPRTFVKWTLLVFSPAFFLAMWAGVQLHELIGYRSPKVLTVAEEILPGSSTLPEAQPGISVNWPKNRVATLRIDGDLLTIVQQIANSRQLDLPRVGKHELVEIQWGDRKLMTIRKVGKRTVIFKTALYQDHGALVLSYSVTKPTDLKTLPTKISVPSLHGSPVFHRPRKK